MSLELIPLVIRKGEKITLANEEGVTIQVGNSKCIVYQSMMHRKITRLKR